VGIGDFSGGLFGIPSSCGLWWLYIVYHYYFHPVKYIHGAAGEKEGILENIVEERGWCVGVERDIFAIHKSGYYFVNISI
jgi:hypothetical protein